MSIASEIERLSGVRSDIFNSITNKGVTVPAGSTFSSCPSLIDQIQGGGPATSMINSGFTASGYASGYRPFTATQNEVPIYALTGEYLTTCAADVNIPTLKITDDYTTLDSASYNIILVAGMNYPQTAGRAAYGFRTISGNPWGVPFTSINTLSNKSAINIIDYNTTGLTASGNYNSIKSVCEALGGNSLYFTFDKNAPVWAAYITLNTTDTWNASSTTACNWWGGAVTGYEKPYPTYPTTTTGYIINEISGKESFTGSTTKVPNIYVSGFKNVVYEDSPEGGATTISPVNMNLTSFSSNMLKNNITSQSNYVLNSTAYSYNYGTTQTAYSGFEGV